MKPSVELLCHWIISWQHISPEVIVRGFGKCAVPDSLVGKKDEEEKKLMVAVNMTM
jgi:hypothetical protein